jgi:hypothetical protein
MYTLGIQAQVVTATITTPPCNNNGVVNVAYSGFTAPVTVKYHYTNLPDVVHTTSSTTTDILNTYAGNHLAITVTDALGNTGSYYLYGQSPTYISVSSGYAICPNNALLTAFAYQTSISTITYTWYDASNHNIVHVDSIYSPPGTYYADSVFLPIGQYYVSVNTANGCIGYSDTGGTVYGTSCFQAHSTTVQPACTNGSITIDSVIGNWLIYL